MSDDISNKKLAGLLAIAIVISLAGTFFSIDKISNIATRTTGYLVDQGTGHIEITSLTSINVTQPTIDWQTGFVNTSLGGACTSGANLTTGSNAAIGTATNTNNCWTGTVTNQDFRVMNIGNTNATIQMQADQTPATFLGGTSPIVEFQSVLAAGGGCNSGYRTTWQSLTTAQVNVCSSGTFGAIGSEVAVPLHIYVPANAVSGSRTLTVTFTGS